MQVIQDKNKETGMRPKRRGKKSQTKIDGHTTRMCDVAHTLTHDM